MSPPIAQQYGIYVHVPWCRARCPYCAFNVEVDPNRDPTGWLDALVEAWRNEATHFPGTAHSLYLGGGTPSLIPAGVVAKLVDSMPLTPGAEVTLEANPGTVQIGDLRAFKDAGINRLSIGVQSLQPSVARRLGRGHTIEQAQQLLKDVGAVGFDSWSMDLIFGVPNQSLAHLNADIDAIKAIEPPHVSLYGLSIEPGTPFHQQEAQGTLRLPDTEDWRAQYDRIVDELTAGGWERYEVSNFARPGHRGRHNEAVWRGGHYAGLGPGAHGFRPDGARTTSQPNVQAWMSEPLPTSDHPSDHDAAIDHILSTLRHVEGTEHETLHSLSGHRLCKQTIELLSQSGLICRDAHRIRLTHEGFPVADGITRRLCSSLSA